jgi:hypothetical protein
LLLLIMPVAIEHAVRVVNTVLRDLGLLLIFRIFRSRTSLLKSLCQARQHHVGGMSVRHHKARAGGIWSHEKVREMMFEEQSDLEPSTRGASGTNFNARPLVVTARRMWTSFFVNSNGCRAFGTQRSGEAVPSLGCRKRLKEIARSEKQCHASNSTSSKFSLLFRLCLLSL